MSYLPYKEGNKGRFTYVDDEGSLFTRRADRGDLPIYFSNFLDTNGDGTGEKSAIGDYSPVGSGQTSFFLQPASGTVCRISRLIIQIEDNSAIFSAENYGGIASPLSSGIQIFVPINGTSSDLTDGLPIKANAHWGRFCYDINFSSFGTGNNFLSARWTFAKAETFIRLVGDLNQRLEIVLNDDLSDLVSHTFLVQGIIEGND